MLLLQLSQPAGDLGEVASLEEAEGEADAAIAPATCGMMPGWAIIVPMPADGTWRCA